MLLKRMTILCLFIAGLAIIAGMFVDHKNNVYGDAEMFGPEVALHLQHHADRRH